MPDPGPHPRVIHDSQHAPSLADQDGQITQPRQTTSQPAVVVLGAPAISLNGSAPHCEHLDGLQPVTPLSDACRECARTARTAGRPSRSA
jgi:hypothetical protein